MESKLLYWFRWDRGVKFAYLHLQVTSALAFNTVYCATMHMHDETDKSVC